MSSSARELRFTATDLAYVLSALRAARDAREAFRLAADKAHEPALRDVARRGQVAWDDDNARIVALLARWDRPEGTARPAMEAATELSVPPLQAIAPGPAHDLRLVAALSESVEAAMLRDRAEMIHGCEPAARDLAEDHLRDAARHLSALRRALAPEHRLRGSAPA